MISEATLKANFRKAIEPYKTDKFEYVMNRGGYMNKIQKYNIVESDVESINANLKYGKVEVDKVDFENHNRRITFTYVDGDNYVVFSYPLLYIRPVNPFTLADGEVRFEEGETYTGYYDDSKKKVSVTFYGLEDDGKTLCMGCSTMERYSYAPMDKSFSVENGVQKLHFYNIYHSTTSQHNIDYITVYADNRTEDREKSEEIAECKFEVGKSYYGEMEITNHYGQVIKTLCVKCLCTKRTARYVHIKWTTKQGEEVEGKLFSKCDYWGESENGVVKSEYYRPIYLRAKDVASE